MADKYGSDLSDAANNGLIDFFITDLTITPSRCTLTYSCESVTYQAPGTISFVSQSPVTCSDFDGAYNINTDKRMRLLVDQADNGRYSGGAKEFAPGTYQVTLKALVNGVTESAGTTSKTFTY